MDFPIPRPGQPNAEMIDQAGLIGRLEQDARRVGVSMTELCKRAGLSPSTFFRWKHDGRSFTADSYNRLVLTLRQIEDTA